MFLVLFCKAPWHTTSWLTVFFYLDSALQPWVQVSPCSLIPSGAQRLMCRRTSRTPLCLFSASLPFSSVAAACGTHTNTHALTLKIVTFVTAYRSTQREECPLAGEQTRRRRETEWEREVAAERWSSCELVGEYELLWCLYLSPPPSFSLCLSLFFSAYCLCPSLSLSHAWILSHGRSTLGEHTHKRQLRLESRWQ